MKINQPKKEKIAFHRVQTKTCFIHNDQVHMKIDWDDDIEGDLPIGQMAVNLETGILEEFDKAFEIYIIKVEGTVL